jgi:SAM-dependent methyltransferase
MHLMKLRRSAADNYKDYAKIYDALKGDRSDKVRLLLDVIQTYRPEARSVIELACGTGTILQGLAGMYEVVGLDTSKQMLRHARRRLPGVPLIHADMAEFVIDARFDVAYCFHNSVNHLLTLQKWEQFFATVAAHLHDKGLFVFDVNPIKKLESQVSAGLHRLPAGDHYVVTQIVKDAHHPERYHWHVDIFRKRHRHGGKSGRSAGNEEAGFARKRTVVTIDAFADGQITAALQKHFTVMESLTLDQAEKPDDVGRAYYICQKL